ncbi:ABC transporter permease [Parasphingorhabdus sp. JC815]|uniref:ABC transporter permease n=1 Tax=Parasphingorhabdus sp. JC815 TaxID=3232140 RepID=UPI003459C288
MFSAFRETFRAVFADQIALMLLFGSVILYSFFYPSAYSGEVADNIPIVIVNNDKSAMSRAVLQRLSGLPQVDIIAEEQTIADAESLIKERAAFAIVLIPDDFERDILSGRQAKIALYGNGAYLLRSSIVLTGMGGALSDFGAEAVLTQTRFMGQPARPPIALSVRPLFNTSEGYGSGIVPGVVGLILQQTLLVGLILLYASRREKLGPVQIPFATFAGISMAFVLIGLVNIAYFSGFVFWFQDYPRGGNFAGLLIAAPIFVIAIVAFALFLGSFFKTRERVLQLWIITSLPLYFLSGLSWPAEATPPLLLWVAKLVPTTAGINLIVAINQMDTSLSQVTSEIINLVLLSLIYGSIAWLRCRPDSKYKHSRLS